MNMNEIILGAALILFFTLVLPVGIAVIHNMLWWGRVDRKWGAANDKIREIDDDR